MSVSGYGTRFISHKEFLRLCKELEINHFNFDQGKRWLELLEKEKILFPICRIIYPLSYLKLLFGVKYNPTNPFHNKPAFYLPGRYKNIHKLKSMTNNFWLNDNLSHILDKSNSQVTKFIIEPKKTRFRKWGSYEKVVGKIQGDDKRESIATHFYSYWQAYHFYEATKACTLDYIINVFDEETRNSLLKRHIPVKKIFLRSLPLKHDRIKGEYRDQTENFNLLSFYIQTILKFRFLVSQSKIYMKNSLGYLDKESTYNYNQRIKTITKIIIKKFNVNLDETYNFLTFLCGRYEKYNEEKKYKLAEFIKDDIYYLILMMQNGYDLEFDTINKKLGRVIRDFGNTLDVIYPPMFAEEKKNVQFTLNSFLSSNKNFHRFESVTREEINDFLLFIETNNLQLFYYSIGQINITQLRDQTIYIHVFYLSLLFENILKIIARSGADKELVIYLEEERLLQKVIHKFFKEEGWYSKLAKNWNLTKVVIGLDIRKRIYDDISIKTFHNNKKWNNIIKMFLVSILARNISAHEQTKIRDIDLETYLVLVNNIVTAIWFSWKYALRKKYI